MSFFRTMNKQNSEGFQSFWFQSADNEVWQVHLARTHKDLRVHEGFTCSIFFFFLFSGCFLHGMLHSLMWVSYHCHQWLCPYHKFMDQSITLEQCKILHRFIHHRKTGTFYRILCLLSQTSHFLSITGKVYLTLRQFLLSIFVLSEAEHGLSWCQNLSAARCRVQSYMLGPGRVSSLTGFLRSHSSPVVPCSL